MSALWPLVWRAVSGRPLRSTLTVVAVALGIAVVLGGQIALNGLTAQATAAQQLSAGASNLDVRVDAGSGLSPDQVRTLGGLSGVAQAAPLYEKRVVAGVAGLPIQGLTVTLVGLQDGSAALRPVLVTSGRLPHPGSTSEVAIDQGLAGALTVPSGAPVKVGAKIQLITSTGPDEFAVVGTTSGTSGGPAFTRSAVFVDDAAMLGTFRLGLRTPLVAMRLVPGATAVVVGAEVHEQLGQSITVFDPSGAGQAPLADLRPLLILVTLLSLIIGAGVTANSVALAVLERRREIGLLRAGGASSRQVFRLFAAESLLLALLAVPLGLAVGIGLGALLVANVAPSDLPSAPISFSAGEFLAALVAGLGAGFVGGLIPAIAAGRMPVLTALRERPATQREQANPALLMLGMVLVVAGALCFISTSGGVVALGVALFLLGVVCGLPVLAPLLARALAWVLSPIAPSANSAAGSMQRNRNRMALTAAGLAVSVATAVGVSTLTAGALTASDSWVSHLFVGDLLVRSPVTQRDAVGDAVQRSADVRAATPLRIFSEPVAGAVLGITALDPNTYSSLGGMDVITPDRSRAMGALENGPSFLVPQQLATAAGWQVGTQLPVQTEGGIVYFSVAGVVTHTFPAGDGGESLVMADDLARTYFGATATGFDDLMVVSDGATGNVAITAATYGMQTVSVSTIATAARASLQHAIGLLLVLAIVAVTIAMLAVVNTLVVNVRQGTRELALMRAVGMGRQQAMRLVLAESGLLAVTATLIGVAVGCLVALPMLRASSSPGFAPQFAFPLVTAIVLVVAVVLAALAATLGPARRAASTSVLSALRHE